MIPPALRAGITKLTFGRLLTTYHVLSTAAARIVKKWTLDRDFGLIFPQFADNIGMLEHPPVRPGLLTDEGFCVLIAAYKGGGAIRGVCWLN